MAAALLSVAAARCGRSLSRPNFSQCLWRLAPIDKPAESAQRSGRALSPYVTAPTLTSHRVERRNHSILQLNRLQCHSSSTFFPRTIAGWTEKGCISGTRGLSSSTSSVVTFRLAQPGEGIAEVELIQWFVRVGDSVVDFDKLCEVQSDKASVEISSPYTGTIVELHASPGDIVNVGGPLVDIKVLQGSVNQEEAKVSSESPEDKKVSGPSISSVQINETSVLATPAVRALARQHQIDLSKIKGTGKAGRILKEDIISLIEKPKIQEQKDGSRSVERSSPSPSEIISEDFMELKGYQRAMFKSMTVANTIPQLIFGDEVDMSQLARVRGILKKAYGKERNITYMPILLKSLSMALLDYPVANSEVAGAKSASEEVAVKTGVFLKARHNIGVAMASPSGLVVPNIKDVQMKSVVEIAEEIESLRDLAVINKLSMDSLSGGTISVSNIGTIGGTYVSPIINPPESTILAIGKVRILPRYQDSSFEKIVPTPIMTLSWSADHRIIDGATIAQLSARLKDFLENPELLLATLK